MGSTKNAKKDKVKKSEDAAKVIKEKQSQKKKEKEKKEKIAKQRKEEKQARNKNMQDSIKTLQTPKTKKEERKEFIESFPETGKTIMRSQRIEAELRDKKRREEMLRNIDFTPRLIREKYSSFEISDDEQCI